MKILQTSDGFEVQVSDEDFEYLNQWSWSTLNKQDVVSSVRRTCNNTTLHLAHELLKRRGTVFKGEVDHKDRNPLNNQFENLRPASRTQNMMNRGKFSNNSSGYKGVSFDRRKGKYRACIYSRGVQIFLGYHVDPIEAAKAYDRSAKSLFKEFAVLNFI